MANQGIRKRLLKTAYYGNEDLFTTNEVMPAAEKLPDRTWHTNKSFVLTQSWPRCCMHRKNYFSIIP